MQIQRRQLLGGGLSIALGGMLPLQAAAQAAWPQKPVRIIIGYTTGGAADTVARAVGVHLERLWGQPVIYEYKPGAGAAIGAEFTARSAGDGYTIGLFDMGSMVIVPSLRKVPYDPVKDFSTLSYLGGGGAGVDGAPQRAGQQRSGAGGLPENQAG